MSIPRWLTWAREIQGIAQNGLEYSRDPFDRERFGRLRALAHEILEEEGRLPEGAAEALFRCEIGPATPRLDGRAVVLENDRVLLVRETFDGFWSLPGGWMDVGESPSEAVARETREEAGLEVRPLRLLAVLDQDRHEHPPHVYHIFKLFFLCERVGGEVAACFETDEAGFFGLEELPPLSTGRVTEAQVRRMVDLAREPGAATVFD